MPNVPRAQGLLALFTSSRHAEGIAGDLAEDSEGGSIRFWRDVSTTIVALWASALTRAPLGTLGLAAAGCWLFALSALGGFAAVALFPHYIGSAASWIVLSSIWWSGALCTGGALVGIGRARGMAVCVLVAVMAEALLVAYGTTVLPPQILGTRSGVFYSIAALAPLALLTAGAIVRLRPNTGRHHILEQ